MMSLEAMKGYYSPECDEEAFLLLTLSGANIVTPIRVSTGFDRRLRENDDEIVYGTVSRGQEYVFLPMSAPLPGDSPGAAASSQIVLHNITRELTPTLRSIQGIPKVKLEVVLARNPDAVEVVVPDLIWTTYGYNEDTITGQLVSASMAREQVPCFSFIPPYFPGLFS